jgi:hypothetical protein
MGNFVVEYKESGNFVLAPQGQFQAVACELLDYGHSNKPYKEQNGTEGVRPVREVQFVYQLNKLDDQTGKRFEVRSKKLNALTLGEKSGLRAFLLSWRGHDITDQEKQPPGLDLETLIGRNAVISVVHTKVGDKTYANIGSIMPIMEGLAPIQPLNYESKQSFVDKQRADAANGQQAPAAAAPQQPATVSGASDQIPF